jgi:hypothetical protein
VRMRSESTVALGQPRETNPTVGVRVDRALVTMAFIMELI